MKITFDVTPKQCNNGETLTVKVAWTIRNRRHGFSFRVQRFANILGPSESRETINNIAY